MWLYRDLESELCCVRRVCIWACLLATSAISCLAIALCLFDEHVTETQQELNAYSTVFQVNQLMTEQQQKFYSSFFLNVAKKNGTFLVSMFRHVSPSLYA